jgi:hypothetical protein
MAAPVPLATTINTYTRFYEETNWAVQSIYPVPEEGIGKSGQQLYEDVNATCLGDPH